MKCHEARRFFGPYWDDETTQAEREWLESHFTACSRCRREYDLLAHTLESVSELPRIEAAPDLLERTLARTHRSAPARDLLPERRSWAPALAAAAALLIVLVGIARWAGVGPGAHDRTAAVTPHAVPVAERAPVAPVPTRAAESVSSVPDHIFDHSDDIEFVLDPVPLRRGRATVAHPHTGNIQTEQAVVSF